MKLVENSYELQINMKILDNYLDSKIEPEYSYGLNLVKRGICFIAVKDNDIYKFYPSRFMGYANNNMDAHDNNVERDGRDTNPAISQILNSIPHSDPALEKLYQMYCKSLGFTAYNRYNRKYWRIK